MNEPDGAIMNEPASQVPSTMSAWCQHRYGGPEVVALDSLPVPTPAPGELLVRVSATALHAGDVRLMRGTPYAVRLMFGIRRPRQRVRGMDVAATVVSVGSGVSGFAPGDQIVAELPSGGGLATYAVVPADRAVSRPEEVTPERAAALPVSAGTAWQALDSGGVDKGGRVLVIGASGGVGTYTVQLAAHRGADVWALTGERSIGLIRDLGATRVLDYRQVQPGHPDLPAGGFDAVIDIAGTAPLRSLQALLRGGGSVVLVSGAGGAVFGPIGRILRAALLSIGSTRRIRPLAAAARRDILEQLLALVAEGKVAPVIEHTYPFGEAVEALAHVDTGHAVGKVVVSHDQ